MSASDDLGTLISFLDDLRSILETFVVNYIEAALVTDFNNPNLISIFRNSFPASKRSLMLSINRLNEPEEDLLKKLDDHGLRGQSLILKIEIINVRKRLLLDEMNKPKSATDTKSTIWSRLKNRFTAYLKAADIPLESLADCIPGLGLALEFKKSVEHVI